MKGSLFDLSGKVALIIGGTQGMGRATAFRLVEHGAQVTLSSRSQDSADRVADDINKDFGAGKAFGVACDVNDARTLTDAVEKTMARWGRIDILISCASYAPPPAPRTEFPAEQFQQVLNSNICNNLHLANLVIPHMIERRDGVIIFITSGAGILTLPGRLPYGVAKAGLTHMANTLATELAEHNVRVNCVSPGMFPGNKPQSRRIWADPELYKKAVQPIPLKRGGDPDEIAATIVYLASPGGAFVTSATIPVDGGATTIHTMVRP